MYYSTMYLAMWSMCVFLRVLLWVAPWAGTWNKHMRFCCINNMLMKLFMGN